jgi:hypothetical protein
MRMLRFLRVLWTQARSSLRHEANTAQSPFSGVEAEGVFVRVETLDRVLVIEAVDARPRPVAGNDHGGVLGRLVRD